MPRPTKPKPEPFKYTVLRDTSEKDTYGWLFEPSECCLGTVERNLYTADYSLDGYYDNNFFVIERKASPAEFAANLTNKEKWDDFKQELERLEAFAHPFIFLEFTFQDVVLFPRGSGIPPYLWRKLRVSAAFFQRRLDEIDLRYKTKIRFVGKDGKRAAAGLFKRIIELCPPLN